MQNVRYRAGQGNNEKMSTVLELSAATGGAKNGLAKPVRSLLYNFEINLKDQPFREPIMTPPLKAFCTTEYRMITGAVEMMIRA